VRGGKGGDEGKRKGTLPTNKRQVGGGVRTVRFTPQNPGGGVIESSTERPKGGGFTGKESNGEGNRKNEEKKTRESP